MLKVALVGAWHVHFDQYSKEVLARDDCKITALWDDDLNRGAAAAEKLNIDFESSYDKLIERDDVEGIVIASATNQHKELIIKAAKKGIHVFTEKVLCFTKEEADEIKKVVNESKIKFCISFPWKCKSEYLLAKETVEKGVLGEITYARIRNAHSGATAGWLPERFYDEKACGGGAMIDLGAHPMYLMLDLFGEPSAVTSIFTKVTKKAVEDNAVSVLEFDNMIAVSETSFVSQSSPFSMEISGTKGTLFWSLLGNKIFINTSDGLVEPTLNQPLNNPLDQWVNSILYGEKINFGIEDAAKLTYLMEKAYESYKTNSRIKIK